MFDTSKIGHSLPPFPIHIEPVKLRELELAVGDPNRVYRVRQSTQGEEYEDIPLPPGGNRTRCKRLATTSSRGELVSRIRLHVATTARHFPPEPAPD
jgi:uridine phosphorylase